MGIRVTTRTRPRRNFPFNFTTTTAAEAIANNLVGPLTLAQVTELIFRVKKLRFVGSISHERFVSPSTTASPSTTDVDVLIPRRSLPLPPFGPPLEMEYETEMVDAQDFQVLIHDHPITASFDVQLGLEGIKKDAESNTYWLPIFFFTIGQNNGDGQFNVRPYDISFSDHNLINFTATLALGGSEIQIPSIAYAFRVTAASLAITVEEWWPYKTTSGQPAWSATTGAPINGGPVA